MIKSDKWIRRMCLEQRMIEPFVEKLEAQGRVSYGLSSYGYDIRVTDEFKIFTNVLGAVVDPKSFDQRSFVDYKGPYCMVPPNSFALCTSMEYFRIPRNVLGLCIGKCLAGETRILEPDGALKRLDEIVESRASTIVNWNCHRLRRDAVTGHWRRGIHRVYRVTTRTGREVVATAAHPFKTFSGWSALSELRPGDRVAVARRLPVFGSGRLSPSQATLLGLTLADGQCRTPGRTSRQGRGGRPLANGMYRWLDSMGLAVTSRRKFVPREVFTASKPVVAQFLRALFSGDGSAYRTGDLVAVEYDSISEALARDVQHLLTRFGVVAFLSRRERRGYTSWRIAITSKDEIVRFAREIGFLPGSRKARALAAVLARIDRFPQMKSNYDTLPPEAWAVLRAACEERGKSTGSCGFKPNPGQSVPRALVADLAARLSDEHLGGLASGDILWDTVARIEAAGVREVFDLTMAEEPNFVANDLIVHNSTYARCGIVVNITPLEAEWEGHLTIEISNTTPLPAKIYSNEGIAQLIFLESDEVCETSYKDRKGKYQAQRGITLPKILAAK